jgi:hypothetical protein
LVDPVAGIRQGFIVEEIIVEKDVAGLNGQSKHGGVARTEVSSVTTNLDQ